MQHADNTAAVRNVNNCRNVRLIFYLFISRGRVMIRGGGIQNASRIHDFGVSLLYYYYSGAFGRWRNRWPRLSIGPATKGTHHTRSLRPVDGANYTIIINTSSPPHPFPFFNLASPPYKYTVL